MILLSYTFSWTVVTVGLFADVIIVTIEITRTDDDNNIFIGATAEEPRNRVNRV